MCSVESTVPVLSRLRCLKYHFIFHHILKIINTLNLKAPTGGAAYGIFSKAKYDLFANVVASRPCISPLGSCTSGSAICFLIVQINRISIFSKLTKKLTWNRITTKNNNILALIDLSVPKYQFICRQD
jgi:hypothetical protein